MKFMTRRLLIGFFLLAILLATWSKAGFGTAFVLASLIGTVAYFSSRLLSWRSLKLRESIYMVIALLVALGGAISLISMLVSEHRAFAIQSESLRARIHEDARFVDVIPTFSGRRNSPVLTLSGTVASLGDKINLQSKASDEFWGVKTELRWRIKVKRKPATDSSGVMHSQTTAEQKHELRRSDLRMALT